ncbi:MAG: class I SAM-dependent methyltransferase [Planctomycetales bacterium]|nr:class I SAM-dependent methyltransferase [Planctomycetales bacterium]
MYSRVEEWISSMGFVADAKILYHLLLKPVRGKTHEDRLESFYGGQAQDYDRFRRRLLQGREQLWQQLTVPEGGIWVDMGGGTGANLEFFGDKLSRLQKVYVVDLSQSLLDRAQQRIDAEGWGNVTTVKADATTFCPAEGAADVVTFSYSLTMIPDWFSAIDNARTILRPGGQIGVVDFYVSRKHPEANLRKHGWLTRTGWPAWFGFDNVYPSSEHIPYLRRHFEEVCLCEERAEVPYLPLVRVPYYTFVGKR